MICDELKCRLKTKILAINILDYLDTIYEKRPKNVYEIKI